MFAKCPQCRTPIPRLRWIGARGDCWKCHTCNAELTWRQTFRIIPGAIAWLVALESTRRHVSNDVVWILLIPVLTFFLFIAPLTHKIVVVRYDEWHCRRCGYDLSGLTSARCPECGGEFPERKAGYE